MSGGQTVASGTAASGLYASNSTVHSLAYNIARIGKSPLLCRIRFYAARNGEFSRTKRAPMRHKTERVLKDSSGSLAVDRLAYNGLAYYSRDAFLLGFPLFNARFALCVDRDPQDLNGALLGFF